MASRFFSRIAKHFANETAVGRGQEDHDEVVATRVAVVGIERRLDAIEKKLDRVLDAR